MGSNIWGYLKNNWKYVACVLTPLTLIAIVFSFPLKTVAVQVEESYWDKELQKHAYTVTETYEVLEPTVIQQIRSETVYSSVVSPSDGSYSFTVKKPDTTVDVSWQGYSCCYPLVFRWFACDSSDPAQYYYFIPYNYYWENPRLVIKTTYPESITTYNRVTKSKDVTRYIDIPTQVLRTRTVTKYQQTSIWSYLFR